MIIRGEAVLNVTVSQGVFRIFRCMEGGGFQIFIQKNNLSLKETSS